MIAPRCDGAKSLVAQAAAIRERGQRGIGMWHLVSTVGSLVTGLESLQLAIRLDVHRENQIAVAEQNMC
jgi:hypothetical protein